MSGQARSKIIRCCVLCERSTRNGSSRSSGRYLTTVLQHVVEGAWNGLPVGCILDRFENDAMSRAGQISCTFAATYVVLAALGVVWGTATIPPEHVVRTLAAPFGIGERRAIFRRANASSSRNFGCRRSCCRG